MADKEILERIDRFENRIKANFLEIEKRLVNLESMSPESAESMKDRIKELEDLQMLLQVENIKIREYVSQKGEEIDVTSAKGGSIMKRMDTLESQLQKFSNVQLLASQTSKPVAVSAAPVAVAAPIAFDKNLEKTVRLELDRLSSAASDVRRDSAIQSKRIDNIEKALDNGLKDLETKIEKIEDLVTRSEKMLTQKGLESFIEKIYAARDELKQEMENLRTSHKRIERFVESMNQLDSKLQQSDVNITKIDASIAKMQSIEDKVKADIQRLEIADQKIDRKISELDDEMRKIDKKGVEVETTARLVQNQVRKDVEAITTIKEELQTNYEAIGQRLESIQRAEDRIREKADRLAASEAKIEVIRREFDRKLQNLGESESEIRNNIELVSDKLKDIQATDRSIDTKLRSSDEKLRSYVDKVEALRNGIGAKAESFDQKIAEAEEVVASSEAVAQRQRAELEKAGRLKMDIEKQMSEMRKLEDTSSVIESFRERLKEYENRMEEHDRFLSSQEKRLADHEKLLRAGGMSSEETRKELSENVHSNIASFMSAFEQRLQNQEKQIRTLLQMRGGGEQPEESSIEKIVDKKLEEFASTLDKKMPDIMTKSELESLLSRQDYAGEERAVPIGNRFEDRLENIEKQLDIIQQIIRHTTGVGAVVVE